MSRESVTHNKYRILIRGSGDIGSAVACSLFRAGYRVAIHDGPAPAATRRGMAFTDAIFDGEADLTGIAARRIDDVEILAEAVDRGAPIPVSIAPFEAVLSAVPWTVLIDARMRKRVRPERQRGEAAVTVGLGPGFIAGDTVDVAVETSWENLGTVIERGETLPLRGEPHPLGGASRERYVYAPEAGTFRTDRRIGELVSAGEIVARIGRARLAAPLSGAIRGLTRDGVPVPLRAKVIEIDPQGADAQVRGLAERPSGIAEGVLKAVERTLAAKGISS